MLRDLVAPSEARNHTLSYSMENVADPFNPTEVFGHNLQGDRLAHTYCKRRASVRAHTQTQIRHTHTDSSTGANMFACVHDYSKCIVNTHTYIEGE